MAQSQSASDATTDPITAEVIRGAMETVAYEMATHVSLTATTPILNQSNERNATILGSNGRLAALSVGIPQFMLSSTLPVRFALEFFAEEGLNEGDVLLANDPYHGGGHLPDYNVFAPVVLDDELVLIASIQCHHADTGGGMPGGYNAEALDIWAEGVRIPAIKLYDRGVERRDILYMLKINNRTPTFMGDLRAQIGAAQLGARRLGELVGKFGLDAVNAAVEHSIEYAKRRFKEEVASWPDGEYEADAYVDHDPVGNQDIHVHVKVTVNGSNLMVDFTGSDERQDLKAYSSFGNTRGYVVAQLATMMDPSIPKNEGFFDSIELVVPKGCVLNPHEGKTVAAGTHHPGVEVGEAIAKALGEVLPERSCPQIYKLGMPTVIYGTHPETGQVFFDHSVDCLAAYCNAVKGQDGWGSMPASFGNLIRATSEINESINPVLHECCDYQIDSGGAGQWRGCPGSRVVKRVLADSTISTYMVGIKYPMAGVAGGRDGSPNHLTIRYETPTAEEVPIMANAVPHAAGEGFEYLYGGGAGWGDPLEREPQKVLEDVLDELVSLESAEADYGLVFTGRFDDYTLQVDEQATERRRAAQRSES
ncbi:MAG: hydantoinase B/oxoprolinase family protein [Proteobacteria bacterium]|nr:hydantoinase B/oxoprolinase family protein [Pseudomonadota bacterium]